MKVDRYKLGPPFREQEVVGSNPAAPTIFKHLAALTPIRPSFFSSILNLRIHEHSGNFRGLVSLPTPWRNRTSLLSRHGLWSETPPPLAASIEGGGRFLKICCGGVEGHAGLRKPIRAHPPRLRRCVTERGPSRYQARPAAKQFLGWR